MTTDTRRITETLRVVADLFDAHAVWHCLAYGTLLGAVRDAAVIPWDYDFDLFVRPADVPRILALGPALDAAGLSVVEVEEPGRHLAVNLDGVDTFSGSRLSVMRAGERAGDLYAFSLFQDGVARRFDLEQDIYWCPHSSVPQFYFERLEEATIDGRPYKIPQHAGRFLAGVYGDDWETPYRAVRQGGRPRPGVTVHGDRYLPKLGEEVKWALAKGWDRGQYGHALAWPRTIRGAGPIGPTARTRDTSRALWWRDLDELARLY